MVFQGKDTSEASCTPSRFMIREVEYAAVLLSFFCGTRKVEINVFF